MRIPTYLSYSAMALWETDPAEYYIKYLADNRPGRLPQTPAMCVGSSFDAFVKAALHNAVFGPSTDPNYEFGALFESQVEPPNRDFALGAGKHCFKSYKKSGSYQELLDLLRQSVVPPQFESTLSGKVGEVPFLGKPDCRFVIELKARIHIILDWKVRQYCSKYPASPYKGYMMCRDGFDGKPTRGAGNPHKLFMAHDYNGLTINRDWMENCNHEWADQCTLYSWLLGEEVGSETVIMIDELCCKPTSPPSVRVANHRARVKPEYQQKLYDRVQNCWNAILTQHIFPDMTKEENDLQIETLDGMATGLASDGTPEEDWFNEISRPQYKR